MQSNQKLLLAEQEIKRGNLSAAIQIYQNLQNEAEPNKHLLQNLFLLNFKNRNKLKAIENFQDILKHFDIDEIKVQIDLFVKHIGFVDLIHLIIKHDTALELDQFEKWLSARSPIIQIKNSGLSKQLFSEAMVYVRQNNHKTAASLFLESYLNDMTNLPAGSNLAACWINQNLLSRAIIILLVVVNRSPKYKDAQLNLAKAYALMGNYQAARNVYFDIMSYDKADLNLRIYFANTFLKQNQPLAATKFLSAEVEIEQNNYILHYHLADAHRCAGDYHAARRTYEKCLRLLPNDRNASLELSSTFRLLGDLDNALKIVKKVILKYPNDVEALNILSAIYSAKGNADKASKILYEAIKKFDDFPAHAIRNYTQMKKLEIDPNFESLMLSRLDSCNTDEQIHLNFALGKYYNDARRYENAFVCYRTANETKKRTTKYSVQEDLKIMRRAIRKFNSCPKLTMEEREEGIPIFIVGMPRSGSTLLEQLISNHSHVTGLGELNYANLCIGNSNILNEKVSNDTLIGIREEYFNYVADYQITTKFFTDKMPLNFRWLGLLKRAIPEAKFVHIYRDPMAVCWSNYILLFTSDGNGYMHSLEDLGIFYSGYIDAMKEWLASLQNDVHNVGYEELVASTKHSMTEIVNYLGLEWENACMNNLTNSSSIITASSVQARQKIYSGSEKKWKNYDQYLSDLKLNLKYLHNPIF